MEELLEGVKAIYPDAEIDNSHEPIASCIKVCKDTEIYLSMGGYSIHIHGKHYAGFKDKNKIIDFIKATEENK